MPFNAWTFFSVLHERKVVQNYFSAHWAVWWVIVSQTKDCSLLLRLDDTAAVAGNNIGYGQ